MSTNSYEEAKEELKDFIDRYRNISKTISDAREDQKELSAEIKSTGYDVRAIKEVIKIMENGVDPDEENFKATVETYLKAVLDGKQS